MRGSIKRKREGVWRLIFDAPPAYDQKTGGYRRKQKWVTFRGTRKDAHAKLNELVGSVSANTFVDGSKVLFGAWLRSSLEDAVKPMQRASTYRMYRSIVGRHLAPSWLGALPLQRVEAMHLEKYYAEMKAAPATVALHHSVINSALQRAVRHKLVQRNVARDDLKRPRKGNGQTAAMTQCWSALEARRFLDAAKDAGTQAAAFFALALDSGARKMELAGLTWSQLDLDAQKFTIAHQLIGVDRDTGAPVFGPTKTGRVRGPFRLMPETVALLRAHRVRQAEVKLRNRQQYRDHGLVFACEPEDCQTPQTKLGDAVARDRMSRRLFMRLTREAGVKPISFHGVRHTTATLLLQTGMPVRDVAERLGHANPAMTLNVYAHAMPDQQAAGVDRYAAVLHR